MCTSMKTRNPAYGPCQDNLRSIAESRGIEDETYQRALRHIQTQCRDEGIDAALELSTEDGKTVQFDALLLCDRKGAGQQIAAQAGITPIAQENQFWLSSYFSKVIQSSAYPLGLTLLDFQLAFRYNTRLGARVR